MTSIPTQDSSSRTRCAGSYNESMRVYFVRHGESVANLTRLKGLGSTPEGDQLTEKGRAQSRNVGIRLASVGLTHLVSSPMVRAQKTARGIAEVLELPLETDDGIYETTQSPEFYNAPEDKRGSLSLYSWMPESAPTKAPDGAESFDDIVERVKTFQARLLARSHDQPLIITHGNFLRFFLGRVLHGDDFAPAHLPSLLKARSYNTGISIFEHDVTELFDGLKLMDWRLTTWMDHAHL